MGIELRVPGGDDVAAMFLTDGRAFGIAYTERDREERLPVFDLSRFRIAVDHDRIVGVIGSYGFEVTLPGGAQLPAGGVTWVSVAATHRRQGLLRRMIEACHDDIDARGDALALLTASEGGIYERFGYGIATHVRHVTIDRRLAEMRPDLRPPPGSVWFVDHDEAAKDVPDLWDRYRRQRSGEVSRTDAWSTMLSTGARRPFDGATEAFHLRHEDGYAAYRIVADWNDGRPRHEARITDFIACTAEAHAALWSTVLGLDLVGPITTRLLPLDDPLPYLLVNPRSVETHALRDGVWASPRDVERCFSARVYGSDDRVVVEAGGQRWAIDGSPAGGSCARTHDAPDIVTDSAGLGALLFGGVRANALAAGRRLIARSDDALRRADGFFSTSPLPSCQTMF